METFTVSVENKEYTVIQLEEKDQVLYEIYAEQNEDMLCLIGLNNEGSSEANCDHSENLVKEIGDAIEMHDA